MMSLSIDDEWNNFIQIQHDNCNGSRYTNTKPSINPTSTAISLIPTLPLSDDKNKEYNLYNKTDNHNNIIDNNIITPLCDGVVPLCDELYISTKTKVVFLNQEINIHSIFWGIPVIEYWQAQEGVVKKQIKVVSHNKEELTEYKEKLINIKYFNENIIKQIDNPSARRIKFKDERKITIGLSKKDIMNCRGKTKNAFYNCFAIIIRLKYESIFREIHVKVFNTGKMEIPGIFNCNILDIVKEKVLLILQPFVENKLYFIENSSCDSVLINSNFNCGFFINREKLHSILSKKYGIETSFDPCSYPGVKCKFYFNNEEEYDMNIQTGKINVIDRTMKISELVEFKKYTEVSFMIFRTGSCLIVGNCSEKILIFIFQYIKKLLADEYTEISVSNVDIVNKIKKTKFRKKTISVTNRNKN